MTKLTDDEKKLIPDPVYPCACFSEHFPANELFLYHGWDEEAPSGFYCASCVDHMEDDRFDYMVLPLREAEYDSLVDAGVDGESASDMADERHPFERVTESSLVRLSDALDA